MGDARHIVYNFLVLTFSVVAIGSPLAYVEKRGVPISTLRLSRLCDLALDQMNEKDEGDARAQRLETTESIRIRKFCIPSKSEGKWGII